MLGLLTTCRRASIWNAFLDLPEYGPIDPSREENNAFLRKFFGEFHATFPDGFLHLGVTKWISSAEFLGGWTSTRVLILASTQEYQIDILFPPPVPEPREEE
ncbi:unnamed protein product [Darwinula stevensoni]|uniref:Uncharacterized protein n=1 Tax=Darwinula stevensoni TaxID=69355 RepID=A0A7R9FNA8_9CRUS|nr:unnamed protein product [Darwinula stevensoni]CAG0896594.1 unnamed protein product [Darwinula stevensoni]